MKCIICKNEKPIEVFTDEHVFPDSIGGTLIIKSVCKECNDKLGNSVDKHLVNHWLTQGQRQILRILGKSGKIPNPLEKGKLSDDLSQEVRYFFDEKGDSKELYLVPKVEKTTNLDGTESVSIKIDKKDKDKLPSIVNKILKRKGLPQLTKQELEKRIQEGINPSPWMTINAEIDILQYKRAILKIAYELAWYWLGQAYLDDEVGEMIRKCMLDNDLEGEWHLKYPIKGRIEIVGERTMFPMWDNEPNSHIAFLMESDGKISCYIRIFRIFEGMIEVSNDASKYPNCCNRFIAIDPLTRIKRESGFVEEINRIGNPCEV